MSKVDYTNAEAQHEKMGERLGIKVYGPERAKGALKMHLIATDFTKHRSMHIALEGESGIGKTAIVKQVVVDDLGWYLLGLRVANMSEGHIDGFAVPGKDEQTVQLCMIEQYKEKIEEAKAKGKRLVIFYDELNRAKPNIVRTLFNVVDEKRWAGILLPPDTAFIVATNPPSDIHNVTDIFGTEAALNSRFKIMGMKSDLSDFLAYADTNPDFFWGMKEYVRNHPARLADFQNMYSGKKYSCPAVLEQMASFISWYMKQGHDLRKLRENPDALANIYSFAGISIGQEVVEFLSDMNRHIYPDAILKSYDVIRPTIQNQQALDGSGGGLDMGHLTIIANKLGEYIGAAKTDFSKDLVASKNLAAFMADLPDEPLSAFVRTLGNSIGDQEERKVYLSALTKELKRHDDYLKTAERLLTVQRKGFEAFTTK